MMQQRLVLIAVVLVLACGTRERSVTLAALLAPVLSIRAESVSGDGGTASVRAHIQATDEVGSCWVLGEDTRATFNGVAMQTTGLGGVDPQNVIPGSCKGAGFTLEDARLPGANGYSTLEVSDPSGVYNMRVLGLGSAREATAPDGGLVPNRPASLGWSHPEDPLQADKLSLAITSGGQTATLTGADLTVATGRMSFVTPALPEGRATIEIDASAVFLDACTAPVGLRCSHRLTTYAVQTAIGR